MVACRPPLRAPAPAGAPGDGPSGRTMRATLAPRSCAGTGEKQHGGNAFPLGEPLSVAHGRPGPEGVLKKVAVTPTRIGGLV